MTTVVERPRHAAPEAGARVDPITHRVARTPQRLVDAHDVRKAFKVGRREIEVLHGISLTASGGEMLAIMGPSGSGKSTLLYCLAGLQRVTAGEVSLLGTPCAGLATSRLARMRRSEVGFVFQQYNLVPTITGRQNVELTYRLRGERPPAARIDEVLASLGVAHLANQLPPSMSGGEQQRVALARVLAQDPRIVFADEPTGALDTTSGRAVLDELRRLAHDGDRAVVTVTHDPSVAAQHDRVAFLRDGWLVDQLVGPSTELVAETMEGLTRAPRGGIR